MTVPEVRRVSWRPLRVPLVAPLRAAHGTANTREVLLVAVETRDGAIGFGEASPLPSYVDATIDDAIEAVHELARQAVGRPVAAIWERPREAIAGVGIDAFATAACALETAAMDLLARDAAISASDWLAVRAGWPTPGRGPLPVQSVVDDRDPGACAEAARERVEAGFATLKLKLFGDPAHDAARVAAVRAAVPSVELRADANGAYDESGARAFLDRARPAALALLEQPVSHSVTGALTTTARIQAQTSVPIALDESCRSLADVKAILAGRAASVVVIKPMVSGLREALEMADLAIRGGLGVVVTTTFDAAVGTAAAISLAASLPCPGATHGLATSSRIARDIASGLSICRDGVIAVPDGHGLGLVLDDAAVRELAIGPGDEVVA